jgi:hypothetical protein
MITNEQAKIVMNAIMSWFYTANFDTFVTLFNTHHGESGGSTSIGNHLWQRWNSFNHNPLHFWGYLSAENQNAVIQAALEGIE